MMIKVIYTVPHHKGEFLVGEYATRRGALTAIGMHRSYFRKYGIPDATYIMK